jgi:ABC-type multidrug transport system ATPase subunit
MKLSVANLNSHYGPAHILFDVALEVADGEVVALLGRNGAGKSTLLRLLTGRARPTSGVVRVLGHELPRELGAVRERINLVPEVPSVYRRSTARENLELFCSLYGLPRERAGEVLAAVRLQDVAGRRVKTFSSGMRQRLLIARALLNRPRVLFLDGRRARGGVRRAHGRADPDRRGARDRHLRGATTRRLRTGDPDGQGAGPLRLCGRVRGDHGRAHRPARK